MPFDFLKFIIHSNFKGGTLHSSAKLKNYSKYPKFEVSQQTKVHMCFPEGLKNTPKEDLTDPFDFQVLSKYRLRGSMWWFRLDCRWPWFYRWILQHNVWKVSMYDSYIEIWFEYFSFYDKIINIYSYKANLNIDGSGAVVAAPDQSTPG